MLSVGNLIPIKGHDLLLRAFAAIQDRFPEAPALRLKLLATGRNGSSAAIGSRTGYR